MNVVDTHGSIVGHSGPMIHTGHCIAWLASLENKSVGVVMTDPPYDVHVHGKTRRADDMPKKFVVKEAGKFRTLRSKVRNSDLKFDSLSLDEMDAAAYQFARVAQRWVIAFCSIEMVNDWRLALVRHGLEYVRTMIWVKECSTPQFTGDRPAQSFEAIVVAHPPGKKRWNAGGKRGIYTHSIVVNRGGKNVRHEDDTTPKPLPLMLELVDDFTMPGELVIDPYAGMGTTGEACLLRGRRFLGCELKPAKAARANERLTATLEGSNIQAREAGQLALMGAAR